MRNKMRVGRKQSDGSYSGAIGKFLREKELAAISQDKNSAERESGTPGSGSKAIRARCLRTLSQVAENRGIEWMHNLQAEHWAEAFIALRAEASKDKRVRGELSANTLSHFAAQYSSFAGYLAEEGAISLAMAKKIRGLLPKREKAVNQFLILPPDRWDSLFEQARARHLVELVFLGLAVLAGMRSSEIRRIRWANCKFGDRPEFIFHRDKNGGRVHKVQINATLLGFLLEWREWLKSTLGVESIPNEWHVVTTRGNGGSKMQPDRLVDPTRAPSAETLRAWAKNAMRELGYADEEMVAQACHIFRRSGAEALFQKTGDVRKVSVFLGHGERDRPNIDTTMGYLGHGNTDDDMHDAIDSLMTGIGKDLAPTSEAVLVPSMEDVLDRPMPVALTAMSLEEIFKQVKSHQMYDELVKRHGAEKVLAQVVWKTAELSLQEQLDLVGQAREKRDAALEMMQDMAMVGA